MSGKANARERVAATFKELLKRFFGDKYTFNADSFSVSRGSDDMADRGADKTLSVGEKSVLAFCYYLAQTHLKVATKEDYERLFFIIDNPVSSLSLDYIYAIVQILKELRIDHIKGDIKFSSENIRRPKMLLLTHNSYFYNIVCSSEVVKEKGLFQLVRGNDGHKLSSQRGFASIHQQQVKHVYDVNTGAADPDFMTPNAIRSVLEGMWQFCMPDLQNLNKFLEYLEREEDIAICPRMIQYFSHGGKFECKPIEQEIIEAAENAIKVVEEFAPGQLEVIKKCSDPDAI